MRKRNGRRSTRKEHLIPSKPVKKEYKPLNLVMNGRYAVLQRVGALIEAEKDYTDKGNFGQFCNILPTIAIDEILQRHGKSADEAFELISTPKYLSEISKDITGKPASDWIETMLTRYMKRTVGKTPTEYRKQIIKH